MKRILAIFALVAAPLLAGCQAPAPSTSQVALTWTAAAPSGNWAGCGSPSTCSYAIYRAPASSGACPASSNASFAEVTNPAARPTGTSWTDTTAAGLTVCYIAETWQSGLNSAASNTAGALQVPGVPLAPTLAAPTLATTVKPVLPLPATQPGVYARNWAPIAKPGTLSARLQP